MEHLRTAQDIAKAIYAIDWEAVQCDDMHENEKVTYLLWRLEQLRPKQALRLLMRVLEAKALSTGYPLSPHNPFIELQAFRHIESQLTSYPTDNESTGTGTI